jgi:hypothetical protein
MPSTPRSLVAFVLLAGAPAAAQVAGQPHDWNGGIIADHAATRPEHRVIYKAPERE